VYFGLADEDLPAAQCFCGHSNHLQAPAWRLPTGLHNLAEVEAFLRDALRQESGLETRDAFQLGGPYFPSTGVTPEIAYPWAIDVGSCRAAPCQVHWVALSELVDGFAHLKEGHLRVLVSRLARALG
jgi:hypothetical protein